MTEPGKTFLLLEDGAAIQCLLCGLTSHHPTDVEQRYCGRCHRWHQSPEKSGVLQFMPEPLAATEASCSIGPQILGRAFTGDELREIGTWYLSVGAGHMRRAAEADTRAAAAAAEAERNAAVEAAGAAEGIN